MRSAPALVLVLLMSALAGSGQAAIAQAPIAPRCVPEAPNGTLLVQPISAAGRPQTGLQAIDPASGAAIGQITLPVVDGAFPTALPDRALAIAGGDLYLIDTDALTSAIISLDGEPATGLSPNPVQFRGSAGKRYLLLGSPSFDRAYLVDVENGTATSLTALIPPGAADAPVFISFAAVTPDDEHVVLWDGQHVYVVATDNSVEARRIDDEAFAFAPDFSPDGDELIYSQSGGPGSGSTLILEPIDGSSREIIKTSERAMVTLWIPGSRTVLVDERTETGAAAGIAYLLDLDTGLEMPLIDYSGSLTTVQLSPDGSSALLGVEMVGSGTWYLADLTAGAVDELDQLAGSRVLPGLYADSRYALAVPFGDDGDPLTGPTYRGIDLQTGEIGRLLEQPDDVDFLQQPILSSNGRYSLVTGESDTRHTIWLLDAVDLRSTELAGGSSLSGAFSPDGCHVGVTAETAIDGIPSFSTTIFSSTGGRIAGVRASTVIAWVK